jgi:WhiB family redox-sensing transcriptional regulator
MAEEFAPDNGDCKGKPVEWWFPVYYGLPKEELARVKLNVKKAIETCNGCKVKQKCLEYSLYHEPWGIWGGLDEEERAHMRSRSKIFLSRDGRINFTGIGLRNANGLVVGNKQ